MPMRQLSLALALLCFLNIISVTATEQAAAHDDSAKRQVTDGNGFDYGKERIRGVRTALELLANGSSYLRQVNLGGWLLSEPFIKPSIYRLNYSDFDPYMHDEYTLGAKMGKEAASAYLQPHWDTWITEDDFRSIDALGLNTVRIPIGYWSLVYNESEPFAWGAYDYLVKAVDVWARNSGLKVFVDLHGAPGSQNSYDNSGIRGDDNSGLGGEALWPTASQYVQRTLDALAVLVNEFGQDKYAGVVTGYCVLNEITGYRGNQFMQTAWDYHRQAYNLVRSVNAEQLVILGDLFQPQPYYRELYSEPAFHNVAIDSHWYSVFADDTVIYDSDQLDQLTCRRAANNSILNEKLWNFVGEFSSVTTDCAPAVNFISNPSRWESSGRTCQGWTTSLGNLSTEAITKMRRHVETQMRQYEKASGWIFWTWKTEISHEWSYSAGVRLGFIPNPIGNYTYDDPCPTLDLSLTSNEGAIYKTAAMTLPGVTPANLTTLDARSDIQLTLSNDGHFEHAETCKDTLHGPLEQCNT